MHSGPVIGPSPHAGIGKLVKSQFLLLGYHFEIPLFLSDRGFGCGKTLGAGLLRGVGSS